jgi:hypothetical protein
MWVVATELCDTYDGAYADRASRSADGNQRPDAPVADISG